MFHAPRHLVARLALVAACILTLAVPTGIAGAMQADQASPEGEAAATYTAFVVVPTDYKITPIDVADNTAGTPYTFDFWPEDITMTPDGTKGFVSGDTLTITPVDIASHTVGAKITIPHPGSIDHAVSVAAMAPDGSTAFVLADGGYRGTGTLTRVDVATNTVSASIPIGPYVSGMTLTPNGSTAFVSSGTGNEEFPGIITPVDVATGTVGDPIDLGYAVQDLAVTPDGSTLYASLLVKGGLDGGRVAPIDVATGTVDDLIQVPAFPRGLSITPNGATAFLFTADGIQAIDLASGTTTQPSAAEPNGNFSNATIAPNGGRVYFPGYDSNDGTSSVVPIDVAGGTGLTPIVLPDQLTSEVAVTPDSATAYVTGAEWPDPNHVTAMAYPIDLTTNTLGAGVPLGENITAGAVVIAPAVAPVAVNHTLTVSKAGTGTGSVTGTGISCGADCTETYPNNTAVTLTATPSGGSTFAGWSGVCTGTGTCQLTMSADRAVTATFNPPAGGAPANDNFADSTAISGQSGSINGTNVDATKQAGEPNHADDAGGSSVWYSWTAPVSGQTTVTTAGSSFDTVLGVYTGNAVNGLTEIAANDDTGTGPLTSSVTFTAAAGTMYRIAVDGFGGDIGVITLNWSTDAGGYPPHGFSDVPPWAEDAVRWLSAQGYADGYDDGTFRPLSDITRGAVARMLWRIAGEPSGSPDHGFSDVPSWADPAVRWLVAQGYADGYNDNTFRPLDPITRGAVARMLWRISAEPTGSPDHGFSDVPPWADPAVRWLVAEGHATGYNDGTFRTLDPITRAAVARMLFRINT